MIGTGLLDWLTVRHCPTRRIYGTADAGLSISNATYPLNTQDEIAIKPVVSYNYGGFRFVLQTIRGVYHSNHSE